MNGTGQKSRYSDADRIMNRVFAAGLKRASKGHASSYICKIGFFKSVCCAPFSGWPRGAAHIDGDECGFNITLWPEPFSF